MDEKIRTKIGDKISSCVNRQSFTNEDMEEICQLFGQQKPGTKGYHDVDEFYKPKPDESRLLHTPEDFAPYKAVHREKYGDTTITEVDFDLIGICKAQDAKTVFVKDAEFRERCANCDTPLLAEGRIYEAVDKADADEDKDEDKKRHEAEELLKPKLTDEFLDTLVQAANTCNWCVDFIEVAYFVDWCFDVAGKPKPPLDVWNDEENNRRRKTAEINSRKGE